MTTFPGPEAFSRDGRKRWRLPAGTQGSGTADLRGVDRRPGKLVGTGGSADAPGEAGGAGAWGKEACEHGARPPACPSCSQPLRAGRAPGGENQPTDSQNSRPWGSEHRHQDRVKVGAASTLGLSDFRCLGRRRFSRTAKRGKAVQREEGRGCGKRGGSDPELYRPDRMSTSDTRAPRVCTRVPVIGGSWAPERKGRRWPRVQEAPGGGGRHRGLPQEAGWR